MPRYDFLIVGAGLYGATFANIATRKGKKCLVIDKKDHIAGNCYTQEENGIIQHVFGPHIFHTSNEKVWKYITQFGQFNNFINSPLAKIGNEIYNLPFNMNLFSKLFHITTPEEAQEILTNEVEKYKDMVPQNLEEQALKLVGDTIYNKFVKDYTEKQWGVSCKNLPASTIKRLPFRMTYDNNYFNDTYQGIPKQGYTKLIHNMLIGIEVRPKTELKDIESDIQSSYFCDDVIFTGKIDEFFDYEYGELQYRSLLYINLWDDRQNFQGNAVVNYPHKDIPYTRCIEHKHFDKDNTTPRTLISYEFSVIHEPGKNTPSYPIENERNITRYNKYKKLASKLKNVHFAGRLGEYKYYDMDDTIEKAMELAEKLTE